MSVVHRSAPRGLTGSVVNLTLKRDECCARSGPCRNLRGCARFGAQQMEVLPKGPMGNTYRTAGKRGAPRRLYAPSRNGPPSRNGRLDKSSAAARRDLTAPVRDPKAAKGQWGWLRLLWQQTRRSHTMQEGSNLSDQGTRTFKKSASWSA